MDSFVGIFGLDIPLHDILRWFHIILVAYWLGGEWGVFNAATNVADGALSLDERLRAMELVYRIDIVPRSAIIWLLPVGFHMADNYGLSPITGQYVTLVWVLTVAWQMLILAAFRARGTPKAIKLTDIDNKLRYVVIPALILVGGVMLVTGEIPTTGELLTQYWLATKVTFFGFILIIGLLLRHTMKAWAIGFMRLRDEGSTPEIEEIFTKTLAHARIYAYVYWVCIGTMAFIGVTKAF